MSISSRSRGRGLRTLSAICPFDTEKRPELQVVAEVSDGLEALQKSEELQPDLILLDIGLPRLNGIEAARRIGKLAPESKIIFLSQESSADVVQEALSSGARGYVVKAYAGIGAFSCCGCGVREGRPFLSRGLSSFTHAMDTPAPDARHNKPVPGAGEVGDPAQTRGSILCG